MKKTHINFRTWTWYEGVYSIFSSPDSVHHVHLKNLTSLMDDLHQPHPPTFTQTTDGKYQELITVDGRLRPWTPEKLMMLLLCHVGCWVKFKHPRRLPSLCFKGVCHRQKWSAFTREDETFWKFSDNPCSSDICHSKKIQTVWHSGKKGVARLKKRSPCEADGVKLMKMEQQKADGGKEWQSWIDLVSECSETKL